MENLKEEEIAILQNIFRTDLSVEKNTLRITTIFGVLNFVLDSSYPDTSPILDVYYENKKSAEQVVNYLTERSRMHQGRPMLYPLVIDFLQYHERSREQGAKDIGGSVEMSYEIVDKTDQRVTEQEFYSWVNSNRPASVVQTGISGKEFFLRMKGNYQEEDV
ncbi:putative Ubiquitin-conjugating enzyme/RWD-like protein [Trachipleistophora hominis]|uniref:Putative Ubiquitin-conjugating enzyme/RWD-like protein n=1 Tax=Trachipleistophora hominis TaxID=72359 RepID=L7JYS9_TRAHO|nr:putative Ubiquitin-conjugating enzyme/RWD-like protein [Trachipleistophora hominis]